MSYNITDNLYIGSGNNPDIILSQSSGLDTLFNANKQDINFSILSTGNSSLTYDASTGRLGIGTGLPDAVLHVVAPCARDGMIVESITNCPTGVTLLLVHNPQTAPQSGSYPAILNLAGRDTNYNEIVYGQIMSKILDPETGATSGELIFTVDQTGINKPVFVANLQNVTLGGNNFVSGSQHSIVGKYNNLTGILFNTIGSYNSGILNSGILVGDSNLVDGDNVFIFATESELTATNGLFLGTNIYTSGSNNILLGNIVSISGGDNILLGNNNSATTSSTVGLAQALTASGISGVVLGSNIFNTGYNNIYIGNKTSVVGDNNNLVGSLVYLTGNSNLLYGNQNIISGNDLICLGSNQTISNINSGIFIGNNLGSSDAYRSIIIGLGNTNNINQQGLSDSILLGINNNLASGVPDKLLLVGQNNIVKDITNSLVMGNNNNASGTVNNSVILGNTNATSSSSNNNIILGILNNQTGAYIDTEGNIDGTPKRINSTSKNSISIGINNIQNNGLSDNIIGNKNIVSGSNDSIIGSFNKLLNASNSYSIGNSNYIVGNNIGVVGSKTVAVGNESIALNSSSQKMEVYGSGNIVLGYNQLTPSGLVIGTNNKIYGISNIIYGRNNTLGSIVHLFTMNGLTSSSVVIPSLNVANKYTIGDNALILIQSPASTTNTFIRQIIDIIEDYVQNTTTLQFSNAIAVSPANGYYSINENFDDANVPTNVITGLIMPYQVGGGEGGPETSPWYGSNNIILGSNNKYIYHSGVVIGSENNVSGVKNIIIGYGISGVTDNALHIGTNNRNKLILDNDRVVFNSGKIQDNFIVKSTDDNTSVLNIDLNNNFVGINTDKPIADLSVSGLTSTSSLRVGLSASDKYVLTSDTNGYATWQLPVRLSGTDNGMVCRINDKVASGITKILYDDNNSTLGFNLDGNTAFIVSSTGIFVNDAGYNYGMRIRGSGGIDFAKILLNTNFSSNRIDFFNTSGNSGIYNNINIISGVRFPTNLTGTFLYVDNSGKLNNYSSRPYSIIYANNNSLSTGDTSFRWFNNQSTLGMGATGVVNYDILATNTFDANYNILLSSNSAIDTVFNGIGLGNKFVVVNSGAINTRRGFYISPTSGQVAINVIPDTFNNVSTQSHLYVEGKTWTQSLRLGPGTTTSGLYLRVDNLGNVIPTTLDLTTQFSGSYPLNVTYTPLGQNNSFRVDIGLSNTDRAGSTLGTSGNGQFLIFDGAQWNLNKSMRVPQDPWIPGDEKSLKGIQFGHKTKLNYTYHTHTFGAGSFLNGQDLYDGSSQFAQYYLRCRTPMTGGNIVALTTNFAKDAVTTENQYNTISLGNLNGYAYDNVWTYNIFVSVLWQDGTSSINPAQGSRYAAGMTIEGSIYRSADGTVFTKLGQEKINIYSTGVGVVGLPAGMGIGTYIDTDTQSTIPRLSIRATGIDGKTALWNATAQIHQLNHPGSYNLYGNT